MALKKSLDKLASYKERLAAGNAHEIKPSHVQKVIDKLEARERALEDELQTTTKAAKRDRLERKRRAALEHLDRARWLLDEIS